MPIYRGEGGSGTGSSGKPGGGAGGGGSTGPVTTRDVLLTNPQRATVVTQEDANQYLVDAVTEINQEITDINQEIDNINSNGGGTPGGTDYGHWKLQVDYGTPYEVKSGKTANFEGKGGVDVSLAGDTVTVDGAGIVANIDADNYQYWTYKIDGFSTTNVMSTQVLDFQAGDGISITKEGYGMKISATGGSGSSGPVKWDHIQDKPPEIMNLAGENPSFTSIVSGGSF
jgi:hypothetical protein